MSKPRTIFSIIMALVVASVFVFIKYPVRSSFIDAGITFFYILVVGGFLFAIRKLLK